MTVVLVEAVYSVEEQYNYPYYQKLIENYGFIKEVDWLERKLKAPKVIDERLERVSSYMMKKCKLKFVEVKSTRQFLKQYRRNIQVKEGV